MRAHPQRSRGRDAGCFAARNLRAEGGPDSREHGAQGAPATEHRAEPLFRHWSACGEQAGREPGLCLARGFIRAMHSPIDFVVADASRPQR
jgi:hypothetical protein